MNGKRLDSTPQWAGMDGAIAWHLIERHADNWNEVGEMMNAWLLVNVTAEREACAETVTEWARLNDCPAAVAAADAIRERSSTCAE